MLSQLAQAAKAAGLAYRLVASAVLIGVVVNETAKYVKKEKEKTKKE